MCVNYVLCTTQILRGGLKYSTYEVGHCKLHVQFIPKTSDCGFEELKFKHKKRDLCVNFILGTT